MRKLTTRESVFLAVAALIAVAIFVYFILLPMLQGDGSGASSSLAEVQEKLESMQKLAQMEPLMVKMEERMRAQSGFGEMLFKRGIADSTIIKYIAEAAGRADIKDIEQLDAKPDTSKSAQAAARGEQTVLGSIIDQMYLAQVMDEKNAGEGGAEGGPSNSNPDSTPPDESKNDDATPDNATKIPPTPFTGGSISDTSESPPEERGESEGNSEPQEESEEQAEKEAELETGDTEQVGSGKVMFPPLPRNIPGEVRESVAETIEAHQGKTIGAANIKKILDDAGIEDEEERERATKSLQLYEDRVAEKKKDVRTWLGKLDTIKNAKTGQKVGTFSVRMLFKSKMDQLVKFLYNLQTSAKWLKVESMRISISDQKENILSVDLSMTAKTLYE
jgi:hypothetical protein